MKKDVSAAVEPSRRRRGATDEATEVVQKVGKKKSAVTATTTAPVVDAAVAIQNMKKVVFATAEPSGQRSGAVHKVGKKKK